MKKFNLSDYTGKEQVVTELGLPVEILSTDANIVSPSGLTFSIIGLVHGDDFDEVIVAAADGFGVPYTDFNYRSNNYDLYFATHHFGWVAIALKSDNGDIGTFTSIIFDTKGEAENWVESYKKRFEENDNCKVLSYHIVEFEWYD